MNRRIVLNRGWIVGLFLCAMACQSLEEAHVVRLAERVRARDADGLSKLLDVESEALQCRTAKAIAWMRGADIQVLHQRVLAMDQCSEKIRAEVLWRLAELQTADALNTLIMHLSHDSRVLRWNAARALGQYRGTEARSALMDCGAKDGDVRVQGWCTWAVCRLDKAGDCEKPRMVGSDS